MTRVLFVCTVPTKKSGIPNVIFNLLKQIDPQKFDIGYVAINDPDNIFKEQLRQKNAKLYIIPRKIFNPINYIRKLATTAKKYDIIHVHGNSATMVMEMLAAKIARVTVRIAHSHNTTCNYKIIDTIARPLFYNLCNVRLSCGIEAGKWMFKKRDFTVINNGIDTERFRFNLKLRDSIKNRIGLNNEIIIGHIGNFVEQKNHTFLIKVFQGFHEIKPNSKLLLLGDGPLKKIIQSETEALGLSDSVIFVGSVNNPEEYMNAMDIVVMPSLFEGLPLTLIEEQANGLSIIAADTISPDANLTKQIQYLPLSDNVSNWVQIILNTIEERSHNDLYSDKAITQIKNAGYDINSVTEDLTKLYTKSLEIWKPRRAYNS